MMGVFSAWNCRRDRKAECEILNELSAPPNHLSRLFASRFMKSRNNQLMRIARARTNRAIAIFARPKDSRNFW